MALEVVGAGWGRTGTESLKKALEILGYNKCYHMYELIKDQSRFPYWMELSEKHSTDYEKLFDGYKAAVDAPACHYYQEIMAYYPEAKIILTVRDGNAWYESAVKTILFPPPLLVRGLIRLMSFVLPPMKNVPKGLKWIDETIRKGFWHNKMSDKSYMINLFEEWNKQVIKTVAEDKLLVFSVKEGWAPLCKFLNKEIPSLDFPHANDSKDFKKNYLKRIRGK